jgi:hypothetical protein
LPTVTRRRGRPGLLRRGPPTNQRAPLNDPRNGASPTGCSRVPPPLAASLPRFGRRTICQLVPHGAGRASVVHLNGHLNRRFHAHFGAHSRPSVYFRPLEANLSGLSRTLADVKAGAYLRLQNRHHRFESGRRLRNFEREAALSKGRFPVPAVESQSRLLGSGRSWSREWPSSHRSLRTRSNCAPSPFGANAKTPTLWVTSTPSLVVIVTSPV